jgi:hypothetical protein
VRDEGGYFFLPVVAMLAIAISGVMLLPPSLDREEFLEARRTQAEQARAAAEAALALAVHRRADVEELSLLKAKAAASLAEEGDVVTIEATGRVPSFRGTEVSVTLTERFLRTRDGTLRVARRDR